MERSGGISMSSSSKTKSKDLMMDSNNDIKKKS